MEMDMHHGLVGDFTVILENVQPLAAGDPSDRFRQGRQVFQDGAGLVRRQFVYGFGMNLWDKQDMALSQRINIQKRNAVAVFEYF